MSQEMEQLKEMFFKIVTQAQEANNMNGVHKYIRGRLGKRSAIFDKTLASALQRENVTNATKTAIVAALS